MSEFSVFLIVLFAIVVQALAGFGSALVAMPLLVRTLGLGVAAPMFVLVGLLTKVFMIARYRQHFHLDAVWRLVAATLVAIPAGMLLADLLPERLTTSLLGLIVIGYALYGLLALRPMRLSDRRWAYGFGVASGLLSGAYNTGGPPYVIYGTSQDWDPEEFKGNLQVAYLASTLMLLFSHTLSGGMTGDVLRYFAVAAPAVLIGLALGFYAERFVTPAAFKQGVYVLLILIGVSLLLP